MLGWMLAAIVLLVLNWLAIFRLSALTQWTGRDVLVHLGAAMALYFTCALTAVDVPAGGRIDLEEAFHRRRRPIIVAFLLFALVAIATNISDLWAAGLAPSVARGRITAIAILLPVYLAGLLVAHRWVQRGVIVIVLVRLGYVLAATAGGTVAR